MVGSRFRKGQFAVGWSILLIGMIIAFLLMAGRLAVLYYAYTSWITEKGVIYQNKVMQHLKLVSIDLIPDTPGYYRLKITLLNDGGRAFKIGYAELCLAELQNLTYYVCRDLDRNLTIETSKPTGFTVFPGEYVTITTSKAWTIPELLEYTPELLLIDPVTANPFKITAKLETAALELNIYASGKPARNIRIELYDEQGLVYGFYEPITYTNRPYYILLKNLIPQRYDVKIWFNDVRSYHFNRTYTVTLTPNDVETVVIDVSGNPHPISNVSGVWVLEFQHRARSVGVEPYLRFGYVVPEGPTYEGWFQDWDMGLGFRFGWDPVTNPSLNITFNVPLGPGRYDIIVGGTLIYTGEFSVDFYAYAYPGNVWVDGRVVNDRARLNVYQVPYTNHLDYTLTIANVTFGPQNPHEVTIEYLVNSTIAGHVDLEFTIMYIYVLPHVGNYSAVVWTGTIWPGDVFELRGSGLVKTSSGLIAYYACDNETSIPSKDPSDDLWWFRSDNAVRPNSTWTIIEEGLGDPDRPEASLTFSFNGEGVVYAWTYIMDYGVSVIPYVDLIIDSRTLARNSGVNGVWILLKAVVNTYGSHRVEIKAYRAWRLDSTPYYVNIGFDEILVVKSQYINITGLRPGYKVIIVNTETGEVIYQETASKNYLTINAEDIGIVNFPLKARVIILRY